MRKRNIMKIGLVRHFKVLKDYPFIFKNVSQSQVIQWFNEYDQAEIEESVTHLGGINWNVCYASDLKRAVVTANAIFNGKIIEKADLREFKLCPIFKRNVKLPFIFWPLIIRLAWYLNHKSQITYKIESLKKVKAFVDELLASHWDNVLVVSHAALMMYLRKELVKCGFTGPRFRKAKNGRLYVYEI